MPERTDPPQDKEPKEREPVQVAEETQPPGEELPQEVEKALAELVEATLENDPDSAETEDSVLEFILRRAEMIYQTPARPVQQLKGQRRGSTPGFGGLLPRQIKPGITLIEKAIANIKELNDTRALSETRALLQHKYGDERPIRVEVVHEEEAHVRCLYDYRIFDFLPYLLEDYVDYVKLHFEKANQHPFQNRVRSQFKAELLAFVRGSEEGQPLYALVSRFMQAYLAHRNPDLTNKEWNEFDPEVLRDFARKNIAHATSYGLSGFAPMEELFPEDPDEE